MLKDSPFSHYKDQLLKRHHVHIENVEEYEFIGMRTLARIYDSKEL